jgi:hypothetical protein
MNSTLLHLIRSDWDVIQLNKYDPDTLLFNVSADQARKSGVASDMAIAGIVKEMFQKPRVTYKDEIVRMVLPPQPEFFRRAMNK